VIKVDPDEAVQLFDSISGERARKTVAAELALELYRHDLIVAQDWIENLSPGAPPRDRAINYLDLASLWTGDDAIMQQAFINDIKDYSLRLSTVENQALSVPNTTLVLHASFSTRPISRRVIRLRFRL